MNRSLSLALSLAALMAAASFGGCERQDSVAQVDPRVDGLLPAKPAPDTSIFEDQREIYKKLSPPPVVVPTPAASAPSTEAAPAATPEGTPPAAPESTPPAPGGEAPPPAPPPN